MTVIRPNSISGKNSITGNGGDISIFRADGTAADVTVNNITSGVITATTFKGAVEGNLSGGTINATSGTITGNLGVGGVLTYEDVTNIDSVGVITARDGIRCTGIVTATAFHGDGANLTGVSGFSTALGNTQGTLENLIFKTTESFTVAAGTSVRIESDNMSGNTAFTRLSRINVATGATFHVSAGTTFIMNVLDVF